MSWQHSVSFNGLEVKVKATEALTAFSATKAVNWSEIAYDSRN